MGRIKDEIAEMFDEYSSADPCEYIAEETWQFIKNRILSNLTGGKKPKAD